MHSEAENLDQLICPDCGEMECACDHESQKAEMLQTFGIRLQRMLDDTVGKRNQIEERWLSDLRQYHGQYEPQEIADIKRAGGSQIFTNITRNKANAAEARLSDMLFPTDDRNWGIQPTPKPDMQIAKEVMQQGAINPASNDPRAIAQAVAQEVNRVKQQATEKAEGMTRLIDDQLTEAKYNAKARDVIHDGVVLGTGVLKGPVVVAKQHKSWVDEGGVSVLQISIEYTASIERVDPWDFFPDMSATCIDDAEYVFERRRLTPRQMREYAKTPGVLIDQLKEVMRGDADRSKTVARDHINDIRTITGIDSVAEQTRYELWEYHGPIKAEDLIAAGMQEEVDEDNPLEEIEGIVHFVDGIVVKVQLNHLDTSERPYSVFNWEKDESSIFGFGVPHQMRSEQRMCNASIRMLLDNAGLSVGDQVVIDRKKIVPADGDWKLSPRKIWYKNEEEASIADAFATFRIDSHQAELTNIFTLGRQLADEVTNLPLIAQGEQAAHVTQTAQGMGMLMNSANIVMRKAVKNWDDDITVPVIGRFYDHNMQYSDDDHIKGDFDVDARGSSALLAKETQARNISMVVQAAMGVPEFKKRTRWGELWETAVRSHQIGDSIIKPDEEIAQDEQDQQQMPDPAIVKAEMDAQLKQQQMELDYQKHQEKLAVEREIRLTEIASRENLTLAQLEAKVGMEQYKEQNKRDMKAVDATNEQAKMQLQHANLSRGYDTF